MTSKYFVHLQVTAVQMMIEICQIVAVVSDIAKIYHRYLYASNSPCSKFNKSSVNDKQ